MKYQNGFSLELLLLYFSSAVVLIGCAPERSEPVRQCPGKSSTEQALDALQSSASRLRPFVAYGSGRVSFYDERDKPRNERIPTIKFWFDPPGNVRFWGEVAFNPRGLDVGSNEREFWLAAKPKEIGNVYIWGLWSQQTEQTDMLLSPKVLRQGLGVIETEENKLWSFSPNLSGDVLTLYDEQGRIVRRVYIDNCQYRISSIEYFDINEELTAALQLGDYQDVGGMFVPGAIKIIDHNYNGTADTFEIKLKSVKPADKIKASIFERPDTKGFEEIRRIIKGRVIKYAQPD
jgi:hypothetical protein